MWSPSFRTVKNRTMYPETFTDVMHKTRAESVCHAWSLACPATPINQGQQGGIPAMAGTWWNQSTQVSHTSSS